MTAPPTAPLSAFQIAEGVRTGDLSPVAVLEKCMARVEALNPTLNALVTLDPTAFDQARAVERRVATGEDPGILAGVPVGIKDVTEVAGLRTTYGSPLFADHVPAEDAEVVRRLRAAGAIIVGKTNTPEFAAGGNTFNPVFGHTRNPWDPSRSAGGSTGGGAAGLATGMFALAQGTDLGGSLRIPASFCGVVGLRPSIGLVPTWPQDLLWDTLQVTGVMGRTALDVALGLSAIAGASQRVPLAQPVPRPALVDAVRAADLAGVRIAYCRDIAGIGIDEDVGGVCEEAVGALRDAGAMVEDIQLDLAFARPAFLSLRGLWFVSQLRSQLERVDELGPNVASNVRAGLAVTTREIAAAEGARKRIWEIFEALFQRFHFLLTPTMAVSPFPVEENFPRTVGGREMETYVDWIAPTFVLSMTGLPVAAVPAGLDGSGMPAGLQIVAPPRGEGNALGLAHLVQQIRPLPFPPGGSRVVPA